MKSEKLYGILIGSFIIIGTTTVYLRNVSAIRLSFLSQITDDSLYDIYQLSQALGALICGLLAFFYRFDAHQFLFATVGVCFALIAYILCIMFSTLYIETILVGAASGVWWVMPPLIIYRFFGPNPFAGVWGTVLTVNFWGTFIFAIIYALFWTNVAHPLYWIFAIFGVFSIIGLSATGYVLMKDYEANN